jgi:hypothetical protein
MKRLSLLVIAMVLTTFVAGANPFSDVPFSHWAYDAVNKLAAKGLIQGYPDGTFKGEKHVTRYALAMITAKMLANVEQMMEKGMGGNLVTKSDLQTLEKLTVEFADELALLGVKVTALEDDMQVVKEDVSTLKKDVEGIKDYMAKGGMEKVKLSGDMLVRHSSMIHQRDYAPKYGNADNVQTQTQLRFQFKANIDENITAVARWHMLDKVDQAAGTNVVNGARWGYAGAGVHGADASADLDLAYLHIKDMFRFGGDFTFGRNFYSTGHALLISDYLDAIKYYKRSGDVDLGFYSIYDSHRGSWKDNGNVNYKNIWGLTLGTKYRDHDLYLNFWGQSDPNLTGNFRGIAGKRDAMPLFGAYGNQANPVAGNPLLKADNVWDAEFGGKGPLGRNGHWDYDLGLVYSNYTCDLFKAANDIGCDMTGWAGTMAVKWDSKKEWAAKIGYTFGTDEFAGSYALDNDRRYDDGIETPYEDISRGNNYFQAGLVNMYDMKLQVEYRPRNTKHYFRLAGDFLDELKDTVSNNAAKYMMGHTTGTPANYNKVGASAAPNAYDAWNNFGVSDPQATVLTFEYRYQLAENTRIRLGYTAMDMSGNYNRGNAVIPVVKAGRGSNSDFDYNMFWAELYSRF